MTTIVQSSWLNAVDGTYAVATNWSPAVIPNYTASPATEYDVTLGGSATSGSAAFTVKSFAAEIIGFLTVNSNATLEIAAGTFTVNSKVNFYSNAYNFGVIKIDAGATMQFGVAASPSKDSAEIQNIGAVTIAGTLRTYAPWFGLYGAGTFNLAGGKIIGAITGGGNTFDNQTDTIAGFGTIGNGAGASSGNGLHLTNSTGGTINANAATALTLNTGTNQIENAGTIETTAGGGLTIASNMQQDGLLIAAGKGALTITKALVQGGGTDSVLGGATILLNNGEISDIGAVFIASGGFIKTTGGNTTGVGTSNAFAGDVLNSPDIENSGAITVVDGSTLNLNASIYGVGKLTVGGSTLPTKLEIFGDGAAFYETGGLLLTSNANNSIVSNGAGEQISNYALLSGAGTIGDGFLRLYNSPTGVVNANSSVGLTILADTAAVTAGTESPNFNVGLVETTGAGDLTITGQFNNAGILKAAGTGALTLDGAQVYTGGGITETTGTGSIFLKNNAQINHQANVLISALGNLSTTALDATDAVENNVSNTGNINIVNNSVLFADGHWQNSGSVNIDGTSAMTTLDIAAGNSLYLLGQGMVNLNGPDSAILSGGAGTFLDNVNNTIAGSGVIGDANMSIDNLTGATIDATGTGGLTLNASPYSSGNYAHIYNTGTIESDSAGGLTIDAAMYSPGKLTTNTGAIVAHAAVYGSGVTTINGTGSVEFGAENDNNTHFQAGGAGSLILDDSAHNFGDIYGFAHGDTIDLRDFAFVSGSTHVDSALSGFGTLDAGLIVNNGTTDSAPIYFEGDYTTATFQFSSDGHQIGATGKFGTDIKIL